MGKALRVWVGVGCIAASLGLGACAREVADGEEDNNASNNNASNNNTSTNNSANNDDNNDLPPDIEVEGDPLGTTYGQGRFVKASAGLCSWYFFTADANDRILDDGYCDGDAECARFGEGLSCDPFIERCKIPCDRHDECDLPDGFPSLPEEFVIECEPWPAPVGVCFNEEQTPCFENEPACPGGVACRVEPLE